MRSNLDRARLWFSQIFDSMLATVHKFNLVLSVRKKHTCSSESAASCIIQRRNLEQTASQFRSAAKFFSVIFQTCFLTIQYDFSTEQRSAEWMKEENEWRCGTMRWKTVSMEPLSTNINATFSGAIKWLSCVVSNAAVEAENWSVGGKKWLSVSNLFLKSNKNKDINSEGQNDDSWLFNTGPAGTMKNGEGGPFQGLHAVPINSCENSDGSCMPHEVIPQAWMENICPTPTDSRESRDKEPSVPPKAEWDVTTFISLSLCVCQ